MARIIDRAFVFLPKIVVRAHLPKMIKITGISCNVNTAESGGKNGIRPFEIAEVPVTRKLWAIVREFSSTEVQKELALQNWGCETFGIGSDLENPKNLGRPVVGVSFPQVVLFCERIGDLTGYDFRPPTLEEWQRAAGAPEKYPRGSEEPKNEVYREWAMDITPKWQCEPVLCGRAMPKNSSFNDIGFRLVRDAFKRG